jgi:hypothetical protein
MVERLKYERFQEGARVRRHSATVLSIQSIRVRRLAGRP